MRRNGKYGQPIYAPASPDRFVFLTATMPDGRVQVKRWRLGGGSATAAKKRVKAKAALHYGVSERNIQVGNVMEVARNNPSGRAKRSRRNPMTSWEQKAHDTIAKLTAQAARQAGRTAGGKQRPYSVPIFAQALVEALGIHDSHEREETVKHLFHLASYGAETQIPPNVMERIEKRQQRAAQFEAFQQGSRKKKGKAAPAKEWWENPTRGRSNPTIRPGVATPTMRDLSAVYNKPDAVVERAARPVLSAIKRELSGPDVALDRGGYPMRGGYAYDTVLAPGGHPRFGARQVTAAYSIARRQGANIALTDSLERAISKVPLKGYRKNSAKRRRRNPFHTSCVNCQSNPTEVPPLSRWKKTDYAYYASLPATVEAPHRKLEIRNYGHGIPTWVALVEWPSGAIAAVTLRRGTIGPMLVTVDKPRLGNSAVLYGYASASSARSALVKALNRK